MPPRKRKPLVDVPLPGDEYPKIVERPERDSTTARKLGLESDQVWPPLWPLRPAPDDAENLPAGEPWDLTEEPHITHVQADVVWPNGSRAKIKTLALENSADLDELQELLDVSRRLIGDPYGPRTNEWTANLNDEELCGNLGLILDELDRRGIDLNSVDEFVNVNEPDRCAPDDGYPCCGGVDTGEYDPDGEWQSVPGTSQDRVRVTSSTGGAKESKLARYDQIPTYPLHCLAEHYGTGNAKYPTAAGEVDNWRKGYAWSLSYAALQRHANAFWSGEDIDAETGHAHLTAVAWHAFALLEWSRSPGLAARFDDRQNS